MMPQYIVIQYPKNEVKTHCVFSGSLQNLIEHLIELHDRQTDFVIYEAKEIYSEIRS